MSETETWVSSLFNAHTLDTDGTLLLYNSYMDAFARIARKDACVVRDCLTHGIVGFPYGPLAELALNGFFVPAGTDERNSARKLHETRFEVGDILQLVLMPTEDCNFRCKYCYESFERGLMNRDVIESIIKLVKRRAPKLRRLQIGWFGGEPLYAHAVLEELSRRMIEICDHHDVAYQASMTTNGYLLRPSMFRRILDAKVRRFQITIDGLKQDHDRLRVLRDGKTGTFDRIINNLRAMRDQSELFRVVIRVNFDPTSVKHADQFAEFLKNEFGQDARFSVDFIPVGIWGKTQVPDVETFDMQSGGDWSMRLSKKFSDSGMSLISIRNRLKPFGSVCYAANPYSHIVGADGTLYKCTVAFNDPDNQVGHITVDGKLKVDPAKEALWVSNGEETDSKCQTCFFRPACQGNVCPLSRIKNGSPPCPQTKERIEDMLRLLGTVAVQDDVANYPDTKLTDQTLRM